MIQLDCSELTENCTYLEYTHNTIPMEHKHIKIFTTLSKLNNQEYLISTIKVKMLKDLSSLGSVRNLLDWQILIISHLGNYTYYKLSEDETNLILMEHL